MPKCQSSQILWRARSLFRSPGGSTDARGHEGSSGVLGFHNGTSMNSSAAVQPAEKWDYSSYAKYTRLNNTANLTDTHAAP